MYAQIYICILMCRHNVQAAEMKSKKIKYINLIVCISRQKTNENLYVCYTAISLRPSKISI